MSNLNERNNLKDIGMLYLCLITAGAIYAVGAILLNWLPQEITVGKTGYVLALSTIIALIPILSFVSAKNMKLKRQCQYAEEQQIPVEIDDTLRISDIEMAVRREGYFPETTESPDVFFFKISGEPFQVSYNKGCFSIRRHYNIGDDIDLDKLRKAAVLAEEELFLTKIYVPTYEDGTSSIVFEVPLLITSAKEMHKLFPNCVHFLLNSIQRHRELYNELMTPQESAGDVSQVTLGHESKFVS